jgi:hypothetical protein
MAGPVRVLRRKIRLCWLIKMHPHGVASTWIIRTDISAGSLTSPAAAEKLKGCGASPILQTLRRGVSRGLRHDARFLQDRGFRIVFCEKTQTVDRVSSRNRANFAGI